MIGSLVSGLLSAGGNIAGSLISAHQAEINREWQSEENQKNRDYQSNEWTRQFNMTNEYNDPKKQVQRMVSAGLNPAALEGASGVSGATPSAPSGASTSPSNPMPETFANLGSSLGNTFEQVR